MTDTSYRSGFDWGRIRVVVLIVVALLLLGYAVFKVGQIFDVFADRYELVTLLPNAAGLSEGAAVTVAGQRVGQVEEIRFIPPEAQSDSNALVFTLSVSQEVQEQIRRDSEVRITTQGLLGDKVLDISPGSAGAPVLTAGDTLRSQAPLDYEQVLVRAAGMLDQAEVVLQNLETLTNAIAGGEGAVGRLLTDDALYERIVVTTTELARTLHSINTSDGTIGRLLRDPALYERLEATLASMEQLTNSITTGEGTLGKLVASDSLYNALTGTVARADSLLASLDSAATLVTNADGTVGRMLRDPALYDELLRSVVELQRLLEDIREDPTSYRPYIEVF